MKLGDAGAQLDCCALRRVSEAQPYITWTSCPGDVRASTAINNTSADKVPSGRMSVADKQSFDESTLTPDLVLAKIQSAYMAGLKRCYKEFLNKDASARSSVVGAIFAPFRRLPNSPEGTRGGHGLGLAIVARIADSHAGRSRCRPLRSAALDSSSGCRRRPSQSPR
jgi:hypothetical protein